MALNEIEFIPRKVANCVFSPGNEHQEQGAKVRNSKSYCKPEQRSYWCSLPGEKPQFVALRGIEPAKKFLT